MFAELPPAYAQYYQMERPGLWLHKIDGRDKLERKWRLKQQQQQRPGYEGRPDAAAAIAATTAGPRVRDRNRNRNRSRVSPQSQQARVQAQSGQAQPVYNYYRTHTQPTYQFVLPAVPAQSPPYHYYYSPAAAATATAAENRANATKRTPNKLSDDSEYCWEFIQKGWCPRGKQCSWKHDTDTICRFYPNCTNPDCRFVHPSEDKMAPVTTTATATATTTEVDADVEVDVEVDVDVDVDVDMDMDLVESRAYQARLKSLKATIEREEKKVRRKLERADTLQDAFKRIERDKTALTEKLEQTEREIEEERVRYEKCKSRLQEIAREMTNEVEPYQLQLDEKAEQKNGLQLQLDELKQQLARKQEEVSAVETELNTLNEDMSAVRARYQSQTDEVVSERNRYEQRTEQLFAQKKKCERTLDRLSKDMFNIQNEEREFEEELEHEVVTTTTAAVDTDQEIKKSTGTGTPMEKSFESDWCWDFMQKGWCQRGKSCQWKHPTMEETTSASAPGAAAASTTPTPTAVTAATTEAVAVDKKDPVCWEFTLFGSCPRGANCHWQHASPSSVKEREVEDKTIENASDEATSQVSEATEGVKTETATVTQVTPAQDVEEEDEEEEEQAAQVAQEEDSDFGGDADLVD
eukprot:CAMPEP_0202686940 /NCGR_PEP_ID=MMETSP1385-20130828/2684_1 /ASSEMBLY_ACC=CAM_ASM_000861 /TAXON_ID=933848 /ORGANISM="Elphidium margaritaceum" /LENGTH=636 /DNA_ID=CAMNT_0049341625 /DNA_START=109 /DNA_END=2019 /DNA_ORIENTATION=-